MSKNRPTRSRRDATRAAAAAADTQRAWWNGRWSSSVASAREAKRRERIAEEADAAAAVSYHPPKPNAPLTPARNPDRIEKLRKSGRLRADL